MKEDKLKTQEILTYYYNERAQLETKLNTKKEELRFFKNGEEHLQKCAYERINDMQANLAKIEKRINKHELELEMHL